MHGLWIEERVKVIEIQNVDIRDRMTHMEVTLSNMAINIDRVARYVVPNYAHKLHRLSHKF